MGELISKVQFLWPYAIILLPMPLLLTKLSSSITWSAPTIKFPRADKLTSAKPQNLDRSKNYSITFWLIWVALVIAFMRPVLADTFTPISQDGYEIVLALDLSPSMAALDYAKDNNRMNRLEATKEVLKNHFLKQREGDKLALVVFGENAYLYIPTTHNHSTIVDMLEHLNIGMAGNSTAIGDAIGVGIKSLLKSKTKNKLIILLTDGQDMSSKLDPISAAKIAADYGIKVYTIGMGSHGLVPIPTESGHITLGHMPLDEKMLSEIAKVANGQYLRANSLQELSKIYQHINKLEKSEHKVEKYTTYTPLHKYLLVFVLLILTSGLFAHVYKLYRKDELSRA